MYSILDIELGPQKCVIGCSRSPARGDIHFDLAAFLGQGSRGQDVVDSPALVAFQRTRPQVIPERELLRVRVEITEDVGKTPRECFPVSAPYVCVKAHMPEMFLGAMHVD